jgi:RNA polymerase sigma factor (sigma-70 family)
VQQSHTSRTRGDAGLVAAAAGGDQAAWNALVRRHSPLLWGVARAHRLSSADAADVVQTTWLRLVEHLPAIRSGESIRSWLATTARRESLRTLRQTARCQPSDDIDVPSDEDRTSVDERLLREERDGSLWRAFGRLSPSDQALLRLLAAVPAVSYAEISAALAMPIGSIGPTRARALERLRRELRATEALGFAQDGRP